MLASGDEEGAIRLWDPVQGQLLGLPLRSHAARVRSVAFRPDGKALASASDDGTVMVWDLDIGSWRSQACRIANRNLTPLEWEDYVGDEPYREICPTGGDE